MNEMDIIDNYFPAFAFYENRRKTTNILSKQTREVKYDTYQLNILACVTLACGLVATFPVVLVSSLIIQ